MGQDPAQAVVDRQAWPQVACAGCPPTQQLAAVLGAAVSSRQGSQLQAAVQQQQQQLAGLCGAQW